MCSRDESARAARRRWTRNLLDANVLGDAGLTYVGNGTPVGF
jgi:hypothetical protein